MKRAVLAGGFLLYVRIQNTPRPQSIDTRAYSCIFITMNYKIHEMYTCSIAQPSWALFAVTNGTSQIVYSRGFCMTS